MTSKQICGVVFIAHRYIGLVVVLAAEIALTGSLLIIYGWTTPLIYAVTFSTQAAAQEPVSQIIPGKPPLQFTNSLLEKASAALAKGLFTFRPNQKYLQVN